MPEAGLTGVSQADDPDAGQPKHKELRVTSPWGYRGPKMETHPCTFFLFSHLKPLQISGTCQSRASALHLVRSFDVQRRAEAFLTGGNPLLLNGHSALTPVDL